MLILPTTICVVFCDRWIRTQFPFRAQQICKPRKAIYVILTAATIDALLHVHLLTPLFGPVGLSPTSSSCGPNGFYSTYVYFYNNIWPVVSIMTVTILPATVMLLCLSGTIIGIRTTRNRIAPVQPTQSNCHNTSQMNFIHRQMFIMMMMTLILFFIASLPTALYRFIVASLGVRQMPTLSLLLTSIFGTITASNYALNFYLHCLTSKLYRKEFCRSILCRPFTDKNETNIHLAERTTAYYRNGLRDSQNRWSTWRKILCCILWLNRVDLFLMLCVVLMNCFDFFYFECRRKNNVIDKL